jgi:hypothetical protein
MDTEGNAAPASKQTSIIMEDTMRTSMLCCLCVSVLPYENKELSVIQGAELQELSATSVLEQEHKIYYSKMCCAILHGTSNCTFQGQTTHAGNSFNLMALFVPKNFNYMNKQQ